MTILYLTFYFEPDLGAGSFRNTTLVNELASQLTANDLIHVVTTHPNRYESHKPAAYSEEERYHGGCPINVQRIKLPNHKSGFFDQIRAFYAYYRQVHALTREKQYDLVFASSSRLFTAFLGAKLGRSKRIPLVLDIRDLFREAILDVLNRRWFYSPVAWFINPLLWFIERYTFGYAHHINLVSEGFRSYFQSFSRATYSYFTNGIDQAFIDFPPSTAGVDHKVKTILYAGNIGAGQGLDTIIPELASQLKTGYRFVIIGDGSTRRELETAIRKCNVTNVDLRLVVHRKELITEYLRADYLFVHLNDLEACTRVLPSKLFEYGATDKPILAGVTGYAASFIREYLPNTILFRPGDANDLVRQLKETPYFTQSRTEFTRQFRRQTINQGLARQIREVLDASSAHNRVRH